MSYAKCLYAECYHTESLGTLNKAADINFELGLESKYVSTLYSNKLECFSLSDFSYPSLLFEILPRGATLV